MLQLQDLKHTFKIIKPKKHIVLLSHMRAYTSLLGHIFGSHENIEGYYEMHTGYYSWKSSLKVKLMYYQEHATKPQGLFMFDKVLHNEHFVSPELLNTPQFFTLIAIRDPQTTIRSILSHYQKVNPEHEYNNFDFAYRYYQQRVQNLSAIAEQIEGQFVYFDADAIKTKSEQTLATISSVLGLNNQLTPNYTKMEKTGARFSGDNSSELFSGEIQTQRKARDEAIESLVIPSQIDDLYHAARETLIKLSSHSIEK